MRALDRIRAGRTLSAYEASRQQWADEVVHPEKLDLSGAPGLEFGIGPDGPHGGRVYHQMRLPAHAETTRQLAGLFPFQAGRGTGASGAYIGPDRFTRGPFLYDPWRMYQAGVVTNLNMLLVGVIGTGKSSLLKTLCLRLGAYGVKFFVPADTKGEMASLAKQVGAGHAALGPGLDKALSPLYAPPRPAWMGEEEYRQQIYQHRMTLLKALGETASGRPLTAWEDTLIDLALREVTRESSDRVKQPSLPELVSLMLEPTAEMAASVPVELALLKSYSIEIALRFRSMLFGALQGVFDGDPVPLNLDGPGYVIDISRIRKSDAAIALTMTCAQALGDLTLTFSKDRWLKVLDEFWRQAQYEAIVRRTSEGQKLGRGDERTASSATLIALHRISDLMGSKPAVRELAMGLLADTSTRILYNQPTDQIAATVEALQLTDVEASLLPSMPKACGLWKIGTQSALVDHLVLRGGLEWDLIQTDSRMRAEGGEKDFEQVANAEAQMAREIGGVA